MTFDSYEKKAAKLSILSDELGFDFYVLALAGEVGEIAEKTKKILREQRIPTDTEWEDMAKELGDVLWYLSNMTHKFLKGKKLSDIAQMNLDKLTSRKKRDKVFGKGDNR